MILTQITTRITSLDNHLLPTHRPTRKSQLITSAAPSRLRLAGNTHGGPPVAKSLVDGPGALVGAHVGGAAVVAGALGGPVVVERLVLLAARADHLAAVGLGRPRARRLAAVPVPRRLPRPRRALRRGQVRRPQEGDGESQDRGGLHF